MASLLEDTSNLMPGRSRKHWNLTEAKAVGKGQKGLLSIAERSEGRWTSLTDVNYRDVPVHFAQLQKAAESLAKKGLIELKGSKFRLAEDVEPLAEYGRKVPHPGTDEPTAFVHIPIWAVRQLGRRLPKDPVLQRRGPYEKGDKGVRVEVTAQELDNLIKGVAELPKTARLSSTKRRAASVLHKRLMHFKSLGKFQKDESVAGAPGAFAISDAEPPSLEAMKADLLDRVRNPRWEYPSWALPKVALDEATLSAFGKKIAKEGKWVKLSGGLIQFRWNGMTYGEIQDRRAHGSRSLDRYEVEDLDDELFEKLPEAKKAVIDRVAVPRIKKDWPGGYEESVSEDGLAETSGIQFAQRASKLLDRKQREFKLAFGKMQDEVDAIADDFARHGDSDGIWDGVQGGMADIDIASRKLRAKAKEINAMRDGRKDW